MENYPNAMPINLLVFSFYLLLFLFGLILLHGLFVVVE